MSTRFYNYKRRYNPAPDCELSYLDEACDTYEHRDVPKDYHSDFGADYMAWKMGMPTPFHDGQDRDATAYDDGSTSPPGPWDHYQPSLLATDRKREIHPLLYHDAAPRIPNMPEGFFTGGVSWQHVLILAIVAMVLFSQTR